MSPSEQLAAIVAKMPEEERPADGTGIFAVAWAVREACERRGWAFLRTAGSYEANTWQEPRKDAGRHPDSIAAVIAAGNIEFGVTP